MILIHLLCHFQCAGEGKTAFNLCLTYHRIHSKAKNIILTCKHFQDSNHDFQWNAKFTFIEKNDETSYT